ncbi:MAG: hypothetical protein CVV02_13595 [Firmicutes bacterium HGW-Firmicutes-7]|nr:MAG: hypothetical protein CVV02_13595 [Firmicutes bacterium HGW-Firmicutes-7]
MNKINSTLNASTFQKNTGMLVGYLVAGYPEKHDFFDIIKKCEESGMDIFEIGFPSNDPYGDGEIIQKAHKMVDREEVRQIEYWRLIRKTTSKPIWIMAYKEDFIDTKVYLNLAKEHLMDAIVIPNCSQQERQVIGKELAPYKVDVLGFVNPTMDKKEWEECFLQFSLVYLQLYSGLSGMNVESEQYEELLHEALQHEDVKPFAGFGIKTPDRAKALIKKGFTGAIVGTAMIKQLNYSAEQLYNYVSEMKKGVLGQGDEDEVCSEF